MNRAAAAYRTWNTKFSLKLGLRSAKLSLLGEHRRWLRSSGRRQTLGGRKKGITSPNPLISLSHLSSVIISLDVGLVRDAALLRGPRQVLDLLDEHAERLGGVVEGEAEVDSAEVVRGERLQRRRRNGETFSDTLGGGGHGGIAEEGRKLGGGACRQQVWQLFIGFIIGSTEGRHDSGPS